MPAAKPSRAADSVAVESRVATIKQRPSSRCYPSVSDVNVSGGSSGGSGRASGSTPRGPGPSSQLRATFPALARPEPCPRPPSRRLLLPGSRATLSSGHRAPASARASAGCWGGREATGQVPSLCPGFPGTPGPAAGVRLAWHLSPCHLWFAVRVRAPGHRRDDTHRAWEPAGPVPGPPSRYDAKAKVNR